MTEGEKHTAVKKWSEAVKDGSAYMFLMTPTNKIWTRHSSFKKRKDAEAEVERLRDGFYYDAQILELKTVSWVYVLEGDKYASGGSISSSKARKILHDGTVHGKALTEKQRKFFGARASGYPEKNEAGGEAGKNEIINVISYKPAKNSSKYKRGYVKTVYSDWGGGFFPSQIKHYELMDADKNPIKTLKPHEAEQMLSSGMIMKGQDLGKKAGGGILGDDFAKHYASCGSLFGGSYFSSETKMAGGGDTSSLKVENEKDLEDVAKYMVNAVKKHSWDLKDLIHYFEKDNNFDYKVRSKIWAEMNVYEMPKTYDNILKLLKAIVEGNGKKLSGEKID